MTPPTAEPEPGAGHNGVFCALEASGLLLGWAVEMMSGRNARYLGLRDRARLTPGLRADLNVIARPEWLVRLGIRETAA